ncbi:MAG: DUF2752 domain-containing protein [Lentisphaeria bacterium]
MRKIRTRLKEAWDFFVLDLREHWVKLCIILLSLALITKLFGTVCYLRLLFGIPCPFCGITRAAIFILQGKFFLAWQMHPLIILVIIFCFFWGTNRYFLHKEKIKGFSKLVFLFLLIFIIFYIYRIRLYYPWQEPMVYTNNNLMDFLNYLIKNWRN